MANGDEAFLDKLWEVRKSKEDSQKMSMYPIEEELLIYMDEAVFMMMKRRRINEYTRRISLVFLKGQKLYFGYQLSVSFYSVTDSV